MTFEQLKDQYRFVEPTYGRFDQDLVWGSGSLCLDLAGNEYIDFTSGIGVNALGFCDADWQQAVSEQLQRLQHTSNLFYTMPGAELAQLLCEATEMQGVFYANSGAEANECAIKAARKYSHDKYGDGRYEIITLQNSFHGRTMATLTATGQEVFHQHFMPFLEGFRYAKAGDLEDLKANLTPATCAVMMELVQGEGGVIPLDKDYVQAVAALCAERDILLIIDEVQTGIGRTGSLFCFQQFGIRPDLVSMAKGLGGGLPIGGVLFGEKTHGVLTPGTHATTFGGNPAVCAGGCHIIKTLTAPGFLDEVKAKGEYIRKALEAMPGVVGVDGMGLMLGVRLQEGLSAAEVVKAAMPEGVLLLTAKKPRCAYCRRSTSPTPSLTAALPPWAAPSRGFWSSKGNKFVAPCKETKPLKLQSRPQAVYK